MEVISNVDKLKEVVEELNKNKGVRWAKKYYKDFFTNAFWFFKGYQGSYHFAYLALEKLKKLLEKHGYIIDEDGLLNSLYRKANEELIREGK